MNASYIRGLFTRCITALRARLQAKGGSAKDCDAMTRENSFFNLESKACEYLARVGSLNYDILRAILKGDGDINPKVVKRFAQFVNGLHAGAYKHIDATTARALIALRAAGGTLNRDALVMLLTGKIKVEGVSPETRGVGIRGLDRLVGRIGRGTVETQLSRSFGEAGFCRALGMVSTDGRVNFAVTLNPENELSARFFALIDNATTGQLDDVFGDEE